MRQPQLTENQALGSMLTLFKITREPKQITQKQLSKESGLPMAKISVLKQQGILECRPANVKTVGRVFEWVWSGYRPNIHMARKLASATPSYPSKNGKRINIVPENKPETPSYVMRSHITVRKTFEVTKSLNGESVTLIVMRNGDGTVEMEGDVMGGSSSVDKLKCWGYAFLTAADEASRE